MTYCNFAELNLCMWWKGKVAGGVEDFAKVLRNPMGVFALFALPGFEALIE